MPEGNYSGKTSNTKSVHALKSKAQKKTVKGVDTRKVGTLWTQPLKKHINVNTENVEFVTINVRVLSQVEHDFLARFPPSDSLYCSLVCSVIAEREHLSPDEASLFSLWIISKDLELQIRPDQDLFHLLSVWNHWILKYTHFPEAEDPSHHINRHWFVYKRHASASIEAEKRIIGEYSVSLLYGEAIRNYMTSRFIVNNAEAAIIAGYQIHLQRGAYRNEKSPPGFISRDMDTLASLIPPNLINTIKSEDWEDLIIDRYKQNQKLTSLECRIGILDFFRNHPCYGGSFFPCCHQLPPSGFFELRQQLWYICIGPNGISIIDTDIHKYIAYIPWNVDFKEGLRYSKVESGIDVVRIKFYKGDKSKEMTLISPQSRIIENLARNILYVWAKDNNVLKKPKNVTRGASMQIIRSHQEENEFPSQQKRALDLKSNSRARHASALVSSGKSLPKDQTFLESSSSNIQITGPLVQNYPGYHGSNTQRPGSMMASIPITMPPSQGYFIPQMYYGQMPQYPMGLSQDHPSETDEG